MKHSMESKPGTSQVSLVKCADYEEERVNCAVARSIELIGGMNQYVKPGDKVLLKVNLLAAGEGVYTHPSVVKAVIGLVKDVGGVPIVSDTPGILHAGKGAVNAITDSGLKAVAEEAGVEAFQLETRGFVEVLVPGGKKLKSIYVAKTALEADVIISMSKLKTHGLTMFTGAVKNMFGVVPPRTRMIAHALGRCEDFSEALVDIYSVVKPGRVIMDGVIGMEGNGPRHGNLKPVGVIMASGDGVALDAVASRVIGFEPMEIHTTRAATNRGLGNGDLNRIKVMGEKISDVETTFKKPSSWQRNIPPRIMSFISRLIYIRLQANIEKCIQCGICEKNCPVGAMHLTPYPTVDTEKCIQCYCCHELCPEGAIIMNRSWLARRIG